MGPWRRLRGAVAAVTKIVPKVRNSHSSSERSDANSEASSEGAADATTPLLKSVPDPAKGLSTFALFIVMVNAMNGPGLLAIPTVYQHVGWILSSSSLCLGGYFTAQTCSFLHDCIFMLHGQAASDRGWGTDNTALGMVPLATQLLGVRWGVVTQLVLLCSLITLASAQIVVTSQALDGLVVFLFGKTFCMQYYPEVGGKGVHLLYVSRGSRTFIAAVQTRSC